MNEREITVAKIIVNSDDGEREKRVVLSIRHINSKSSRWDGLFLAVTLTPFNSFFLTGSLCTTYTWTVCCSCIWVNMHIFYCCSNSNLLYSCIIKLPATDTLRDSTPVAIGIDTRNSSSNPCTPLCSELKIKAGLRGNSLGLSLKFQNQRPDPSVG